MKVESEDPDWNYEDDVKSENDSKNSSHKRVKCEICSKTFNKVKTLEKHVAKMHSEPAEPKVIVEKKYKCKMCDKSYSSSKALRGHVKHIHENHR